MINKKQKIKQTNNILLESLFKSKNFYGESLNKVNKNNLPFIYGVRHNYSIINLKYVSFFLKRIFKLIQYTIKKNQNILIIGNSNDIDFLTDSNFTKHKQKKYNKKIIKNKNLIYFNKEWIHGLITNNKINSLLRKKNIKLILIIKSSVNDNYLNTELLSLKIPLISMINTDQKSNIINYPIITNSKNIKSLYILMYLIRKIF